ncbi:4-hydroxybenzoate polyprenyltransferase-like prenyltransferase [Caldisphaera lagunensis DSM 15908]|uniref:4-hydroxybenzoate polyprenyltransferase-like prenyltransferase n=1 Tax=Caldisphaera lagunensis (strain DSM 15908 / JCM 11604 / ANMR 0165 / IC-154) TaxID=1056495 RepID=L0A834_CALLD|nr:geranylgeranylglycerol-phosphate geranylgeranyltransferase [Caldisphaera lagunensis]AFZ69991.1 4-hydroxybenzoate polyprenyltransferase-like prenyltransferase [Caldisphaera lagunensis DSM 15908]
MIKDYIKIIRPLNDVMIGFSVIVGSFIASGRQLPNLYSLLFGFLTGFFISASSMVFNDIMDIEIDKINNPNRPLPSGKIKIRNAYTMFYLFSIIGLLFSALTGIITFIIAIISYFIAYFYNKFGKKSGFLGNIMVAYSMGVPILYGAAMISKLNFNIMVYWLMIFLSGIAREVTKGIADVEGDRKAGIKTIAVIMGEKKAAIIAFIFYAIAILLSPIPVILGKVYPLIYSIPIAIVDMVFLSVSIITIIKPTKQISTKNKNISLLAMFLGLLGFLISTKP